MMSILCKICDRSNIEKQSEYSKYLPTLRTKNDKSLYKTCTIKNVKLDEFDKILSDYVTTHNKKFDCCFVNCEFKIEFDNNFIGNIETNYFYNMDFTTLNSYLLYYIDCFKSRGYKFCNINQ